MPIRDDYWRVPLGGLGHNLHEGELLTTPTPDEPKVLTGTASIEPLEALLPIEDRLKQARASVVRLHRAFQEASFAHYDKEAMLKMAGELGLLKAWLSIADWEDGND